MAGSALVLRTGQDFVNVDDIDVEVGRMNAISPLCWDAFQRGIALVVANFYVPHFLVARLDSLLRAVFLPAVAHLNILSSSKGEAKGGRFAKAQVRSTCTGGGPLNLYIVSWFTLSRGRSDNWTY